MLKWKRATWHHQKTHDGKHWVEREEFIVRWHPHRSDLDEAIVFEGFPSREEAKAFCEKDANENLSSEN